VSFSAFCIRTRLSDSVFPRFYAYFFRSQHFRKRLALLGKGTNISNLNQEVLKRLRVPIPSHHQQVRVVDTIRPYDDLIENNRRRIHLLEQSARLLYKEWFVHLRFPGHEHVKSKNGVPDGWVKKTLDDLTTVVTKGTTPTTLGKAFVDEGLHFIKVESISDSGSIIRDKLARVDEDTHNLLKRSKLIEGDILFSIAGAIGRSAIVPMWAIPANTNQAIAIIRPVNYKIRYYLYWVIRSDDFLSFSMGRVVQTAQANVSLSALKSALIMMPVDNIINAFIEIVTPIHKQIDCLNLEINSATEARDLLLPRLMNGMITV
jgi:type I restriction enzyme S subunit